MSFLQHYLEYTASGECPPVFHRWSALTGIGALLERSVYIKHGHTEIYPNMYVMLLGDAGSRKSTAIRLTKKLLLKAGYETFAAEKTSKEKFLADLAMQHTGAESILETNLFGDSVADITPILIAADEANDFFGLGNLEFISLLGSLWDWNGKYENKVKHGKSDFIPNPTVSILSGNTPTNFALAFPASILGQGFFSRLLIVHGEATGNRIAFPESPAETATQKLLEHMIKIKQTMQGQMEYTKDARALMEKIYLESKPSDDPRFISFHNRRFSHLMKLCMIVSACHCKMSIDTSSVIEANTYLTYAETFMPKALGEFGKARDSDITNKVLGVINSVGLVTLQEIWAVVSSDLDNSKKLGEIVQNLLFANKIQTINGKLAPRKKAVKDTDASGLTDLNFLTKEERNARL